MPPTVDHEQPYELPSHSPAAVPVFASDAPFHPHLPKPLRHPKTAPTRSPTSRPAAAPPLAASNRADGPRPPYPRSPSAASIARLPGLSVHPQMLPSHPAALPNMYDSTASTSEGGAGSSDDEPGVGHSYMSERRRREEARARRRAKHASSSTTTSLNGALNGSIGRQKAESVGRRADAPQLGTSSRRIELKGVGIEATGKMPTVFGQEGLGLVVGLADADYQAVVDDASLPPLNSRSVVRSTYSSSLGSAVPSPALSASPFPTHSRTSSHHLRETSEPAITFQSPRPVPSAAPPSPHAHFLPSQLPQETRDHSQSRQIERAGSVALQPDHIVFPTTLSPESPASTSVSRRPSSTFSFSGAAVPCSSPTTSVSTQASKRNSIRLTPGSPRARSPRRAAGPTTIVGDILAQQEPSRLYFPPPPKSRTSIASPDPPVVSSGLPNVLPSPAPSTSSKLYFPPPPRALGDSGSEQPFSPVSSTFPSRVRQSSVHSASSAPSSHRTAFPSAPIPPSPATSTFSVGPFPPPPSYSPHARFLSRVPQSASDFPVSPSYGSTLSAMSTNSVEPVFPTLGAQLHADGVVRASAASRRVSPAPWEDGERDAGDELDRMMRAQRRTASDEEGKAHSPRERAKEKERKRKSIYQELIRAQGTDMPPLPTSPQGQHEDLDSFQRELFARDTVKKSLGTGLLSEQPSLPPSEAGDERDEDLDSVENLGLTSSSTSSDISTLPSFPDVPTHAYQLVTPSPPSGSFDDHDEVEVVLSQHSSTEATARSIAGNGSPRKQLHRLSMSSSGQSLYEDASEDSSATTQEETSPPRLEMARQQTSLWVLDTLASTIDGSGRKLNDIGEEEEEAEEILQLPVHSAPVTPLAPTFPSISTPPFASKLVFPSPASTQALPNPPPSPTLSQGSYSTSSSAAAVSYTLPRRADPTSSATSLPLPNTTSSSTGSKSKLKLPKKLGALFGSSSSPSYNAAALGIRGHGISSRDIARLTRPNPEGGLTGAAPQQQHQILAGQQPRTSLDWDAHTRSTSFSSGSFGAAGAGAGRSFPLVGGAPSSVPSTPTFAPPEFRVTPPSGRPSLSSEQLSLGSSAGAGRGEPLDDGAGKLADLLSRFEKEEKERIRGIATARSKNPAVGVV
ncbi:hypothetical protein JCM5296_004729 [Sporobolomyces johnsonii]